MVLEELEKDLIRCVLWQVELLERILAMQVTPSFSGERPLIDPERSQRGEVLADLPQRRIIEPLTAEHELLQAARPRDMSDPLPSERVAVNLP